MKTLIIICCAAVLFTGCHNENKKEKNLPPETVNKPLAIGYSVSIKNFTSEKLAYAKSSGIDFLETSGISLFVDKNADFKLSDEEIVAILKAAKKTADDAGMDIWSIHMPFGANIDLSLLDETARQKVVSMHKKLLGFLKILEPEIILFHPSYYLGLNERDKRKIQLIKSAKELDKAVQSINAKMVIENMLGYELKKDENRERPLMRTVEETVEIMNHLPETIYSAIDMNHIKNPEKLIMAMGSRLKSVHIADGSGKAENHYFPCSEEGQNDWVDILSALNEVGYSGPFMYECHYKDEMDLVNCYETLYRKFINKKGQQTQSTNSN